MNKKEIYLNKQKTLSKIKRSSLSRTAVGNAKFWKGTTYKHYMTIAAIVWKLSSQGYEVYTETEFVGGKNGIGKRADIFIIDQLGNGTVIEVLHSESEVRLEAKIEVYPFPIYKIYTKNFDINNWDF